MGPPDPSVLLWDHCLDLTTSIPMTKPTQELGLVWPEVRLHQCLLQKLPCERNQTQKRGLGFPPMGVLCPNSEHALE